MAVSEETLARSQDPFKQQCISGLTAFNVGPLCKAIECIYITFHRPTLACTLPAGCRSDGDQDRLYPDEAAMLEALSDEELRAMSSDRNFEQQQPGKITLIGNRYTF